MAMFGREKRFVVHSEAMGFGQAKILMDRLTGVHYLFFSDGSSGGLTPLLDSSGNIVIQPLCEDDELDDA